MKLKNNLSNVLNPQDIHYTQTAGAAEYSRSPCLSVPGVGECELARAEKNNAICQLCSWRISGRIMNSTSEERKAKANELANGFGFKRSGPKRRANKD